MCIQVCLDCGYLLQTPKIGYSIMKVLRILLWYPWYPHDSLAVKKAKDHREILQGHTHTSRSVLFSSLLWRKMFLIVNAPLSLLPSLSNALLLTLLPFFCRTISWMASYFLLCLKINLSNYIHQWNKKSEVNLWEVIGKDFSSPNWNAFWAKSMWRLMQLSENWLS